MSKKLVAFFSASGTTKKVAQMIAEEAKADLFEIEPKVPYTKLDLDWMNKKSRSSVEMSDKKYRPAIMKKEMDMSSYDEILLGFPIWWYVAPTIVNTFLEAYDFSGKKIVLFAPHKCKLIKGLQKCHYNIRKYCYRYKYIKSPAYAVALIPNLN